MGESGSRSHRRAMVEIRRAFPCRIHRNAGYRKAGLRSGPSERRPAGETRGFIPRGGANFGRASKSSQCRGSHGIAALPRHTRTASEYFGNLRKQPFRHSMEPQIRWMATIHRAITIVIAKKSGSVDEINILISGGVEFGDQVLLKTAKLFQLSQSIRPEIETTVHNFREHHNGHQRMSLPHNRDELRKILTQPIPDVCLVIYHQHRHILDGRDRFNNCSLTFPGTAESQIEEFDIQFSAHLISVAHSRTGSAPSLRYGRSVNDELSWNGANGRRNKKRTGLQSNLQKFQATVILGHIDSNQALNWFGCLEEGNSVFFISD